MITMMLTGNLGKDAEVRQTNTPGRAVINFNVAVSLGKDSDGKDRTQWVSCSYFKDSDKTKVAEFLKKGQKVFLRGAPSARPWVDQSSNAQASLELVVYELELLGSAQADAPKPQASVGGGGSVASNFASRPAPQAGGYPAPTTVNGRPAPAVNTPNYANHGHANDEGDDVPF
jgi:single-strand DNA-binding protein